MSKYEFPFTNALTFAMVMQNEEFCIDILRRILPDRRIKGIHIKDNSITTEKTIIAEIDAKSVRLDVLFEDEDAWYDIEMQVADLRNIPKRSQYIHAMINADILKRGEDYNELKPSYVIFLCCFDYFKLGNPIYFFEMYDKKLSLSLGDGCYTILVNSTSKDPNTYGKLRNLFDYMMTGRVEENDSKLKKLDREVESLNHGKGLKRIMTLYEQMQYEFQQGLEKGLLEGKAIGVEEGKALGKVEGKSEMIKAMAAKCMNEKDIAEVSGFTIEEINAILGN